MGVRQETGQDELEERAAQEPGGGRLWRPGHAQKMLQT